MNDQFPYSSPNLDDTQPHPPVSLPLSEDTQPRLTAVRASGSRLWWVALAGVVLVALLTGIGGWALLDGGPASLTVTLVMDEQAEEIETAALTVADLLAEQGIVLEAGDLVVPGQTAQLNSGDTVTLHRARTVTLTVDGTTSVLRTPHTSPYDILQQAEITVTPGDDLRIDGTPATAAQLLTWPVPPSDITLRRAVLLTVVDGDTRRELRTTAATVGAALDEAGITLYLPDTVSPQTTTPVSDGLIVTIDRSRDLTLVADGRRIETRTQAATVAAALDEVGVVLNGLDYTVPAEDAAIQPGMIVRVMRVTEEIVTEEIVLPYETLYQADPELELDRRLVLQAGQDGARQQVIRVRYENGVEVSRVMERDELLREPVNRLIAYGTNVVLRTIETPDGSLQYWRRLRVYATSYHPAALGGDNITSVGEVLRKGIVGVDPDIIPYYTNLYVEGYGTGIAADTGAPRSNPYWIDLGYEDHDYQGWHWWVDVYLLTPVPDSITYLLPQTARGGPVDG